MAARQQARQVESVDLLSESDSEDSEDMSGSDADEASWISWFCSLRGNEFFCEVEEAYIEDDFNLSGLASQVPYYDYALDMILDNEPPADVMLSDQQHEMLENAAEMLYGLIHARYLVTARGLSAMLEKFKNCDFGRCPRVLCDGQPCLPVGTSDLPGTSTVKIFCPKCEDIYYPRIDYQCSIDGAYFGTTFPHLMLMTYPMYRPPKSSERYVPRVFGFKLHPTAYANREQQGGGPGAAAAAVAAAAAGRAAALPAGGAAGGSGQQQQQQAQARQQQQQSRNGPPSAAAAAAGGTARQQQQQQGSQLQSMDQDEEQEEDAEMGQEHGGGSQQQGSKQQQQQDDEQQDAVMSPVASRGSASAPLAGGDGSSAKAGGGGRGGAAR